MNTLGGVSLEAVVQQPPCSTLAEQQPNLSFTGKENKQDPPRQNEPLGREICALTKGQRQSLTFCLGDAYTTHEGMMLSTTSGSPSKFKIIH